MAAVDFHSNRFTSYLFKRPYGWEEVPMFNARKKYRGGVWPRGGKDFCKNKSSPPLPGSRDFLPSGGRFENSRVANGVDGKNFPLWRGNFRSVGGKRNEDRVV